MRRELTVGLMVLGAVLLGGLVPLIARHDADGASRPLADWGPALATSRPGGPGVPPLPPLVTPGTQRAGPPQALQEAPQGPVDGPGARLRAVAASAKATVREPEGDLPASAVPLVVKLEGEWPPECALACHPLDNDDGDEILLPVEQTELHTVLVAGRWKLEVKADGLVSQIREIHVPAFHSGLRELFVAPSTCATLRLHYPAQGEGRTTNRSWVHAEDSRGGTAWGRISDEQEVVFRGLAPGVIELTVYDGLPGWNPATDEGTVRLSGGAETVSVPLQPRPPSTYTYTPTPYVPTYQPTTPTTTGGR